MLQLVSTRDTLRASKITANNQHAQYPKHSRDPNALSLTNAEYKLLSKKGEGTFSEVIKAVMIKTNKVVAIKRMKNQFESIEQVNNLREIQALKRLSPHPCIIRLVEVL